MKRLIIFAFLVLGSSEIRAEDDVGLKQSIAYVRKLQTSTGGFLTTAPRPNIKLTPTLRATSAGVRALHYLGGETPDAEAAAKFVAACWDEASGGFSDIPRGKPDVATTAIGLMAVKALKMPMEKYGPAAVKYLADQAKTFEEIRIAVAGLEAVGEKAVRGEAWLKEVRKLQNDDGVFGKGPGQARATGGGAVVLLRLGVKLDDSARVLAVLKEGQRLNGGFGKDDDEIGSDLETTYRVMRCFHMLKQLPKNVEGVRSFVAKCRNEDGGYAVAPGEPSSVSGVYYAAIILSWLK